MLLLHLRKKKKTDSILDNKFCEEQESTCILPKVKVGSSRYSNKSCLVL